ncbi:MULTISPECIES: GDP-mannose 4,6-dehydratase [Sphingomonas]|uniref:GDP-mannose 4,6-dehydratase n=1 Tax=Sphingomonas TaxID=13687 RepID=UPI000DF00F9D|nr:MULTISPECIES: GDP-mannose 4,6-dehydratase [Sphingomonas]
MPDEGVVQRGGGGRRILVTGLTGFTGRYLHPLLADAGYEVHGTVQRTGEEAAVEGATLHVANLSDAARLAELVAEIAPTDVVHLAAIAFVGGDARAMYETNLLGSRNLLEALAAAPERPSVVLMASSANVYGNAPEGVLDETMPPAPANDYGVSKLAMEALARTYADRLPITLVRPFNYTGRGQAEHFLIPKIVAHARRREPRIELGNLDVARDFSDVRTVVDAYARLLDRPELAGQVFNVCSGRPVTLQEIVDRVAAITGARMAVVVNPSFVRANEVRSLSGSATRLEAAIGPLRAIPLDDTLRWMLDD